MPVDWADGRVAHQDPEPVGRLLDVVEQRQGGLLEQIARAGGGQRAVIMSSSDGISRSTTTA